MCVVLNGAQNNDFAAPGCSSQRVLPAFQKITEHHRLRLHDHGADLHKMLLVLHKLSAQKIFRARIGWPHILRQEITASALCTKSAVHFTVYDWRMVHWAPRRTVIEEIAADLITGDPALVEIPVGITDQDRTLENLMEAVHFALQDEDGTTTIYIDYLARALAAHLVRRYSGSILRGAKSEATRPEVMRAVDHMHANIDRPIGLADLAETVGRSPSYLSRQFREQLGKAPHAYLIEMRFDLARELLEQSNDRIATIALDCGSSHQEHLTRLFRRKFNTTPVPGGGRDTVSDMTPRAAPSIDLIIIWSICSDFAVLAQFMQASFNGAS